MSAQKKKERISIEISLVIGKVESAADATYLEQCFWVTHDIEKSAPARHFCLARTTHYHIESNIEVI
jgi:hypothetical protein